MTRLFVVRHGNTFEAHESPRRIGVRSDVPLTATGRAQAQALAAMFHGNGVRFARAYCGSLRRTRSTASAILAGSSDAEPGIADWLTEIDHGPDEGAAERDVVARIGRDALEAWDHHAIPPPGWQIDAAARIAGWRTLLDAPPAGDTLVVTSNGAARFAFFAGAIAAPPAGFKLRTGAYGVLEAIDGRWQLGSWDVRPPA